jgi:hypothetical protein
MAPTTKTPASRKKKVFTVLGGLSAVAMSAYGLTAFRKQQAAKHAKFI